MDISNWPLDKIMQLPDCCFGRRWPIIFTLVTTAPTNYFRISEITLPDVCVLWELFVHAVSENTYVILYNRAISLALGDHLPADDAQFTAMANMFPEANELDNDIRSIRGHLCLTNLRKPYKAQGQRVILRAVCPSTETCIFSVGLVFSSLPKEVPDWLISGPGRSP